MDIKNITESVRSLKAVEPSKLDPSRFAEGLSRIQELHREVESMVAEDRKLAWDGKRLHDELESVEKAWSEAIKAPTVEVSKLQEQQTRTLKVVKLIAETGLKLKKQLADAQLAAGAGKKKLDETLRRGKGWMERATKAEQGSKLLERKYDVATTALDLMTERYHTDTTALGRRLLQLEFKPTDETLLKRIKEAKSAKELATIREELKPKTDKTPISETTPEAKKDAATSTPPAPVVTATATSTETKPETKPAVTESKEAPKPAVYLEETTLNRPFNVAESLKVGRDLVKTA